MNAEQRLKLAKLQGQAQQYQKAMEQKLRDLMRTDQRRRHQSRTTPRKISPGLEAYLDRMGGIRLPVGVAPDGNQIREFIRRSGGNPYLKKARAMQEQLMNKNQSKVQNKAADRAASMAAREIEQEQSELERFFEEAQSKYDKANEANEKRYQDILERREASRARNLERVSSFGNTAREDLEERATETLGDIQANLSARGLGDSTIFDAFRQRNARDLAREQQRLAEMIDARTAQYDTQATEDLVRFMERRTDAQPDFAQLSALAAQYGLGNDGRGFNAERATEPPAVSAVAPTPAYRPAQPINAVSPYAAINMAAGMQGQLSGLNPFGMGPGGLIPRVGFGRITSNRYPSKRRRKQKTSAAAPSPKPPINHVLPDNAFVGLNQEVYA